MATIKEKATQPSPDSQSVGDIAPRVTGRHGDGIGAADQPRLRSRMEPWGQGTDCWRWSGGKQATVRGIRTTPAHAIYLAFVGPLLPGWVVGKQCGRTRCVNPDHLYAYRPKWA